MLNRFTCSKLAALGCVIALSAASASSAQAQVWNGYNSGFYGGLPYSVYSLDSVPYYALHPPVYYSHIVPRPYGYSPYAYPPGIMTPDRPPGTPQTIHNPHASPSQTQKPESRVAQAEPKTIINPYFDESVADKPAPAPRKGKMPPKTIRPAALALSASKQAG